MMDIASIGSIEQIKLQDINSVGTNQNDTSLFKDILSNAINAANETDAQAKADQIAVATGQSDDLHTLMIDVAKADLALQTLVQLRNKALDAYNEIMKITL